MCTIAWSLTESAGLPVAAYAVAAWLGGRDAGLIAGLAVMMITEPTGMFLMLSTVVTIALVGAGTGASTLWFLYALRRLGLWLRFAPA